MNYFASLIKVLNHPFNRTQPVQTLGRIGWWKLNQWFFHLPAKVKLSESVSLLCYPTTSFGSYVVYARWPEYAETRFLLDYLRPNDVFIDVGAHLGELSLLAASKITKGKVLTFEPTPHILPYLHENIALNRANHKIKVIEKAVSDQVGTARFVLNPESEVNHLRAKREITSSSIKVPTTTIDREVINNKLSRISLLKIDVEGAEINVLIGAKKNLHQHKIEAMMIEVNPRSTQYQKGLTLFSWLDSYKYLYFTFNEDGTVTPLNKSTLPAETINILAITPKIAQGRLKPFIKP